MISSRLTTLGGFTFKLNGVSTPGPPTRKARALMAFLVMNRGADTARERLVETFWPDVDGDHARNSLITALSSIRSSLRELGAEADDFLLATKSVVRWTTDTHVDAHRFAELATRDDAASNRTAVRLYRGDFLEGDYDNWAVTERERLITLYETVLARAVRNSRDPEAARLLIARNPYAEEAYATLIETELEAGRNASAAALSTSCRKALVEVGEKPSPAFEERFGHIKLRSLEVPPSNLPRQTTSFVGRDVELAEAKALLAKSRLVTIVGAGGVGKTRVAIQAGAQALHEFEDGVWFVDLATIEGDDAVSLEIASAFGVRSTGFRALFDHVLAHLKQKRLLLVLDNCEHVVAEAAQVVDALIRGCPHVTVLATSRESLGVKGEHVYRLPSLEVPPPDERLGAEAAEKFGAVALFLERAKAADARFAFTDDVAHSVVEMCRRLDGIALAIELAAARVDTLNVHHLLERLHGQFRLLRGHERAAHPRHQTMNAALDWSYEWLTEEEKSLFRHLAILRGGWTVETIHAADVDESLDEFAVLEKLWPLVNKSLVAVEFRAASQRYRLMEPLRQYGLERLREQGEFEATALEHARYFAEFARRAGSKWLRVPELEFLTAIEEEIDNLRAALEWALAQGNDPVLGAEIATHLGPFWFTQYYHEGLRWLESARVAVTFEDHPSLSVALGLHRLRAYLQTNLSEAIRVAEETLGPARALGDEWALVRLLFLYGWALVVVNRLDEAEPILKESLGIAERVGDGYRAAWDYWMLARLNRRRGKFDIARELSNRMAETYDQLHLQLDRNRWTGLAERARVAQLDGNLPRAIEWCREGYNGTQLTKDVLGAVHAEYYLGVMLLLAGDIDEARRHGRSVLKLSSEEFFPHGIPPALQLLAGVAAQRGERERAARLLGFAEASFRVQTFPRDTYVEVDPEWFIGPLRSHFSDGRLAELMAEGAAWSEDRAIEEALKV